MEMLIGGTWQPAASGRTEEVTSPFDRGGYRDGAGCRPGRRPRRAGLALDANRGIGLDKIGVTVHQPVGIVAAITSHSVPPPTQP